MEPLKTVAGLCLRFIDEELPKYSTLAALHGERQISIRVRLDDWKLLERSAATIRKPVSRLVMELLSPGLRKLRANPPTRDDAE